MGPPGSGKGTQARRMVDELGYVQLATGDLFRAHLSQGTELGKLAQTYMSKGQYVPDDVTTKMVRERLADIQRKTRIVFDGFPRTVAQAEALDLVLEEIDRGVLSAVLDFELPDDIVMQRLLGRAAVEGRSDDLPDKIRHRLDVYHEKTEPLVDYYRSRGLLVPIHADRSVEDVFSEVQEALEAASTR